MLSFDEFRAINARERNREKTNEKDIGQTKNNDHNSSSHNNKKGENRVKFPEDDSKDEKIKRGKKSLSQSIGEFLEYHPVQIFYVILLITKGDKMILHYFTEILQTQAFDVLLSNFFWICLWGLLTWRLHTLEKKIREYLNYAMESE